jgi:hypothetical protein
VSEPEVGRFGWAVIGLAWLASAFGGGAVMAWWFRRLYPDLSFHKLWALWTVALSLTAATIFLLGLL